MRLGCDQIGRDDEAVRGLKVVLYGEPVPEILFKTGFRTGL